MATLNAMRSVTPAADPARRQRCRVERETAAVRGAGRAPRPGGRRCGLGQLRAGLPAGSAAGAGSPLQYSARSQPAASACRRQVRRRAGQRLHRQVVGHQNSFEADPAADDPPDHGRRQRRRQRGVPARIEDVRRHRPGQVGVQGERQQVGVEVGSPPPAAARDGCRPGRGHDRARACRPAARRPPAGPRPGRGRAGRPRRDRRRRRGRRSRSCAPGMRRSSTGAQTTSKPALGAVEADQRAGQPGGTQAGAAPPANSAPMAPPADARASAAGAAGRPGRPPGRPSARRRGGRTRRSAAIRRRELARVLDVAGEQDDAGRRVARGTAPPRPRPARAGDADDGGLQDVRAAEACTEPRPVGGAERPAALGRQKRAGTSPDSDARWAESSTAAGGRSAT